MSLDTIEMRRIKQEYIDAPATFMCSPSAIRAGQKKQVGQKKTTDNSYFKQCAGEEFASRETKKQLENIREALQINKDNDPDSLKVMANL